MKIAVAFASLTGNTITVATAIQQYLSEKGFEAPAFDLLGTNADSLREFDLVFLGSSTYGEGDLNPIAELFFTMAKASSHDCDHTKFAIVALGDSSYTNFAESGTLTAEALSSMHAEIVEPVFTIDGPPDEQVLDQVRSWVESILQKVMAEEEQAHA
jgi:flavodoxin